MNFLFLFVWKYVYYTFHFGRYFGRALNSMSEIIFFEHFNDIIPLFLLKTGPSVLYSSFASNDVLSSGGF